MGLKLKVCAYCGATVRMGRTKKRCKDCRRKNRVRLQDGKTGLASIPPDPDPNFSCGCHLGHTSKEQHTLFWERYATKRKAKISKRGKGKNLSPPNDRPAKRRFVRPKYHDYITSKAWERRRNDYYSRHPRQCHVCGSRSRIQLHHLHYRTLGRERDEDLQPLCDGCHSNLHEGNVSGAADPMTKEFMSLVARF